MRPVPERLFPFRGRYLDRGGLKLHYLDEGVGEPVLMVHGNPTWSFYWRKLVAGLAGGHRCVVPDHVGCGLSDKPDDSRYPYTLASRVADLEALADHLELDGVTLVVHDWGGAIGCGWAVRHPGRVRRLVILNTAAFHLPAGKSVPWQLRLVRDSRLGVFLVRRFNAFARGAAWVGCTRRRMPREVRDAYCAPYDSWASRIATARFVQDIPLDPADPAYPVLDEISAGLERLADRPVLICWGEKDFVFDHHFLAEWERRFPRAEVHRFADCGHYVMEDAAEEILPLVRGFVDGRPAAEAAG